MGADSKEPPVSRGPSVPSLLASDCRVVISGRLRYVSAIVNTFRFDDGVRAATPLARNG